MTHIHYSRILEFIFSLVYISRKRSRKWSWKPTKIMNSHSNAHLLYIYLFHFLQKLFLYNSPSHVFLQYFFLALQMTLNSWLAIPMVWNNLISTYIHSFTTVLDFLIHMFCHFFIFFISGQLWKLLWSTNAYQAFISKGIQVCKMSKLFNLCVSAPLPIKVGW